LSVAFTTGPVEFSNEIHTSLAQQDAWIYVEIRDKFKGIYPVVFSLLYKYTLLRLTEHL